MILNISILPDSYSIYRFKSESEIPDMIYSSDFYSITKTKDEISVVAPHADGIDLLCNQGWRVLKIAGPLDFSIIGIIADVSTALRNNNIATFIISTYDTDYILIRQKDLIIGIKALTESGHNIQ